MKIILMEFMQTKNGKAPNKSLPIFACDSSILDAPNIDYTKEQFKKLNNTHLNKLKKELIRFRASCIIDTQSDFILTAEITNQKKVGEVELALKHIDNLDERIGMKNTITTYDRGYCALELMFKHYLTESFFVMRLKSDDYQKEINRMTTDDEIIEININRNRTQNFHDKELKKQIKEIGRLPKPKT